MMRLPPRPHEWIDRGRELAFRFEGRTYGGFAGDTVASALAAHGVRLLGRSFKYHRPRGLLTLAGHDANALLQWGGVPNLRAEQTPLVDGMVLTAVNTVGSLRHDRAALLDRLAVFLPVGFYYKAFFGLGLFPFWERRIRRLAGLGRVELSHPREHRFSRTAHCDVLVVGGGPSGLSAALAAAEAGARVILAEEDARLGGTSHGAHPLIREVLDHPNIRVFTGAAAVGCYADRFVPLLQAEGITRVRARSLVVATGCAEQPAVFRHNDLPGIMLASAADRLIERYAVRPGHRAAIIAANSGAYATARRCLDAGMEIVGVFDLRPEVPAADREVLGGAAPVHAAAILRSAHPDRSGLEVGSLETEGGRVFCDTVLVGVGYAPLAALLYQAGARMRFDSRLQHAVPEALPPGVFACGRVNGVYEQREADGERAGLEAARWCGLPVSRVPALNPETVQPSHPFPVFPHPEGKEFVDFDEDLQVRDLQDAVREGFDTPELLKRYTTLGMGPSQGRHSNLNGLRILAETTGQPLASLVPPTARPFARPIPLAHLAGHGFHPERRTPLTAQHEAAGAVWALTGGWWRPLYYRPSPELGRAACIEAEVRAVREHCGLIDVGTLGKILVRGPRAAELMDRLFIGRYSTLRDGQSRYAVRCDESGVIVDDGLVVRLGPDAFYVTTTSSAAASAFREFAYWNTVWELGCSLIQQTGFMAAVNLAGPRAREVLAPLCDADLDAIPFLGARQAKVADIPALLVRVGFVGEWSVEIHVPAGQVQALWQALLAAGAGVGLKPFGVEAQRVLRLEKGHIIIGQDTDGLTTPREVGLDWLLKPDKPFFLGGRSLQTAALSAPKRRLVGFRLPPDAPLPRECDLVVLEGEIAGRVTSAAVSPTLGFIIGLAYVPPALAHPGSRFPVRVGDGRHVEAEVVPLPFYDPENRRQKEPAC